MKEYLKYKGKPLVRKGDEIYYGSMAEKFVVMFRVMTYKKVGDLEVADKIKVQLINTDETVPITEKIVNTCDRNGLYAAMDVGAFWLEKALRDAK